ncbi:glycosyltransferase [Bacteroides caccae]|uniref:Glycosyltransferase family 4 protein n=1 Tax=Bacteroides caccae TaxID=47678 RepID=A0A6A1JS41_9BACE|nr:glycosyltransferase [Bacteroides caccae]KAA5476055.1 glycosyltransferase family 4 protein [Bacteroides caccae]KAA5486981.1 glycosyltransferase family 4 protein [Bacteroides caccae]KAA5487360.1 glycosyltransferase family 4 protein [Bacteroides caccae]KAA5501395.1 glycosyltransferase family 4 protein [Bacteroides caccae]
MKALMLAPMGSVHRRFNKANIDALHALGYEVELCANFENGDGPEIHNQKYVKECEENGIKTHSILFARHSLTDSLKCLSQLKELLKNELYDIVHTHTETGGLLLKLAHGVKGKSKFFYTPHGMSFWKGSSLKSQLVYKPLERWICSGMDVNLGMNMEEVEYMEHWNKCSATYVHGIGLNVDRMQNPVRCQDEVRKEFGLAEGDKFVVSIGELDDNKNHVTVIRALAKLPHKDWKYVLCGVGPNRDILFSEVAGLGLKDNVIFAGYRSDIPDILNAADIFVFPSYHEGMPVSVLEAMACGLPIICSEIRGNVDIIKGGDNGYLFQPNDANTLGDKLTLLMNDVDKRKVMGCRNKEIVKDFSLDAVTEELKKIYSSVL